MREHGYMESLMEKESLLQVLEKRKIKTGKWVRKLHDGE